MYLGLFLGSLSATYIFPKIQTKSLIIVCLYAYILSLIMFLSSDNFIILSVSRSLVGYFQVYLCIFFPVWNDVINSF